MVTRIRGILLTTKVDCHVLHMSREGLCRRSALFEMHHHRQRTQHVNQRYFYRPLQLFHLKTLSLRFHQKKNLITNGNCNKLLFSFYSGQQTTEPPAVQNFCYTKGSVLGRFAFECTLDAKGFSCGVEISYCLMRKAIEPTDHLDIKQAHLL